MEQRLEIPLIDGPVRAAWQRRDLVIALLHAPGCAPCDAARAALKARRGLPDDPELAVAVLTRGEDPEADARIDALLQAARVSGSGAFALVADRFLALYAELDVHARTTEALLRELSDWAEAVIRQCGECSRMEL